MKEEGSGKGKEGILDERKDGRTEGRKVEEGRKRAGSKTILMLSSFDLQSRASSVS